MPRFSRRCAQELTRRAVRERVGWLPRGARLIFVRRPTEQGWEIRWSALLIWDEGQFITVPVLAQSFLTASPGVAQTWTSPLDWNNANNQIQLIAGGGSGAATQQNTTTAGNASGAGGAEWGRISNYNIAVPGTTTVDYLIGAGGAAKATTVGGGSQTLAGNAGQNSLWDPQNLQTQSQLASGWSLRSGGTLTANATTAPDGNSTAATFVEGTGGPSFWEVDGPANTTDIAVGATYTVSIYVKLLGAGTNRRINFGFENSGITAWAYATFDVANGAFVTGSNFQSGYTYISGSIGTDAVATGNSGNGWYRVVVVATISTTDTRAWVRLDNGVGQAAESSNYVGDGVSGIQVWGAQINIGSTARAYKATTTATFISLSCAGGAAGGTGLTAGGLGGTGGRADGGSSPVHNAGGRGGNCTGTATTSGTGGGGAGGPTAAGAQGIDRASVNAGGTNGGAADVGGTGAGTAGTGTTATPGGAGGNGTEFDATHGCGGGGGGCRASVNSAIVAGSGGNYGAGGGGAQNSGAASQASTRATSGAGTQGLIALSWALIRLSQQYAEVIDSAPTKVRLSQQYAEVIDSAQTKVRLSQQYVEVIKQIIPPLLGMPPRFYGAIPDDVFQFPRAKNPLLPNLTLQLDALAGLESNAAALAADSPVQLEGLGSVTEDSQVPLEVLSNALMSMTDSPAPLEVLAAQQADIPSTAEALTGIQQDGGVLAEILTGASVDRLAGLEAIVSHQIDRLVPLENLGATTVTSDSRLLLESILSQQRDLSSLLEVLAGLRWDGLIALEENLATLVVNRPALMEALAGVGIDRTVSLEDLAGVVAVSTDSRLLLEAITALQADSRLPVESLFGLRADRLLPLEVMAAAAVYDRTLSLETLTAARIDGRAPLEALSGLRTDLRFPAEFLASLRGDGLVPLENLGATAIIFDRLLPLEIASTVVVTTDSRISLEVLAATAVDRRILLEALTATTLDRSLPLEAIAAHRRDGLLATEVLTGLRSDRLVPLEHLSTLVVVADRPALLEAIAAQRLDRGLLAEALTGLRRDVPALLEVAAALASDVVGALELLSSTSTDLRAVAESAGLVFTFASDGVLQLEIQSNVSGDRITGLEWRTVVLPVIGGRLVRVVYNAERVRVVQNVGPRIRIIYNLRRTDID